MKIEGKVLAKGEYTQKLIVPSKKTINVDLPLEIDTEYASYIFKKILTAEDGLYAHFKAKARFETVIGGIDVNFEDKKKLLK
jgi:LEA14-like dessication related protein